jgi:hypothetical protein
VAERTLAEAEVIKSLAQVGGVRKCVSFFVCACVPCVCAYLCVCVCVWGGGVRVVCSCKFIAVDDGCGPRVRAFTRGGLQQVLATMGHTGKIADVLYNQHTHTYTHPPTHTHTKTHTHTHSLVSSPRPSQVLDALPDELGHYEVRLNHRSEGHRNKGGARA